MKRVLLVVALVVAAYGVNLQTRPPAPQTVREPTAVAPNTPVASGQAVYGRYGCAACHGNLGTGGFANPNSETDGKVPGVTFVAEGYTKGELRKKILDGFATVKRNQGHAPRCVRGIRFAPTGK